MSALARRYVLPKRKTPKFRCTKSGPSNKARGDPLPPPLPANPSSAKATCRRAVLSVTPIIVPPGVDTLTRPQLLMR
eukprot:1554727-Ditylum_brightwellii.AAC.1